MSESVGEILAAARRKKGKSLAEAEAATRIRARRLEAIEKSDWDALPDPAYVKGYIIGYAKYLGLDPQPLVASYLTQAGVSQRSSDFSRLPEQVVPSRHQAHAVPWKGATIVAVAIAVITLLVWGGVRFFSTPDEEAPMPPTTETTATTTPESTPSQMATTTAPTTTPPAAEPFTLRVEIAEDGASWLRVTVDGLKAYEGTLAAGQTKEWEVNEAAVVRIGKRDNVTVYKDDVAVEIPTGDVPEMTISAVQ